LQAIETAPPLSPMPLIEISGAAVEYRQSGSGPDLLMLHSLLTDLTVFDRVVPELARDYRVTCINLPGFGSSTPRAFETVADHADHVAAVMEALRLSRTAHVFGNGFGGFVALELAIRHGSRFDCLLVADALATFPEPARAPFRVMADKVSAAGMEAILDTAINRMFPSAFSVTHPEIVQERRTALSAVHADCFARACLALARLDLSPALCRISNPALIMCGSLDQTTPPDLARLLARRINDAVFQEIPDCGHCPMLEQPQTLVTTIKAFLSRIFTG
jgi:3-oxoadipate enol-lactonase